MMSNEKAQMLEIVNSILNDEKESKPVKKMTNTIKLKTIDQSEYRARSGSSSNSKGTPKSDTLRIAKFKFERKAND